MIAKPRSIPLHLQQYEALLRRLPENHAKKPLIQEEYLKRRAGYKGETSIDYYLSYLEQDRYMILHDLRLLHGSHFFQLDTLLLSPSFFLILEVKNIAGKLHFDTDFQQLIRKISDREEGFPDPILQVNRQKAHLKSWLQTNKFPAPPIESLIVISNPSSIIETLPKNLHLSKKVCHAASLPVRIEKIRHTDLFNRKELMKIAKKLTRLHIPYSKSLLEQYQLTPADLLKGVHCPSCSCMAMQRLHGKWRCTHCQAESKDAYVQSIDDYFLLVKKSLTNKELRIFLNLQSTQLATRLLTALNLTSTGSTKDRTYHQN